jgi:SAM-dependent methyltransferase
MAEGRITRGTTGVNRLRRVDRWIATLPALRAAVDPIVVDLGYGARATTALELHERLRRVRADVRVVGIEIDPDRVRAAKAEERPGVTFRLGGFEIPGERPTIIRALNVLRQYDESEVAAAWQKMVERLQPGGVLVEGTCNEIGRVCSWVAITSDGPQSFTVSLRLDGLDKPSIVAERLPKVLIHRNVAGERIHEFLGDLDRLWQINAPLSVYGPSQRWIATAQAMRESGWPVLGTKARWRLGELSVGWASVAPRASPKS